MIDILIQYFLFLAKALTVVIAIGATIGWITLLSKRGRAAEELKIKNLNKKYEAMTEVLKRGILSKKDLKKTVKVDKARKKAEKKKIESAEDRRKKRIFVLNFRGDIKATAVSSLREEISAVLSLATPEDEVLVRLENAGGLVHEHGLAASQLLRIKQKKIPLTIVVDKVAASGGYMMACIGDHILAAPFAIIGSIGVLAQLPNFSRLLDRHGIDFEQIKAGEYKRTITLFGKNTAKERAKLKEDVEDMHGLFKEHVAHNRPGLDIARVATGEHWYGARALELKLVDDLVTSDDYLLASSQNADLYEVTYTTKKAISEKLVSVIQLAVDKLLLSWWQRAEEGRFVA